MLPISPPHYTNQIPFIFAWRLDKNLIFKFIIVSNVRHEKMPDVSWQLSESPHDLRWYYTICKKESINFPRLGLPFQWEREREKEGKRERGKDVWWNEKNGVEIRLVSKK